ncbi:hypothetical protein RSK60_1720047 [Ralstonia solanacearum K60]|nr:hypothetical protein RSK60_1720047 [Ralstonia solanacearum K60]
MPGKHATTCTQWRASARLKEFDQVIVT